MNQPTTTDPLLPQSLAIKEENQSEVIRQSANLNQPPNSRLENSADVLTSVDIPHSDAGAFLADFAVPDIDDDVEDTDAPVHVDAVVEAAAAEVDLIGQDAFFTVFKTAFVAPQFFVPDLAVLAVQPEEEPAARAASDATYGLLKIYYPAALTPKGEVLAHLMIAGPFLIGKVMIVREVLRARRAKPANPPEPPEPPAAANDNYPPNVVAVDFSRQGAVMPQAEQTA